MELCEKGYFALLVVYLFGLFLRGLALFWGGVRVRWGEVVQHVQLGSISGTNSRVVIDTIRAVRVYTHGAGALDVGCRRHAPVPLRSPLQIAPIGLTTLGCELRRL